MDHIKYIFDFIPKYGSLMNFTYLKTDFIFSVILFDIFMAEGLLKYDN